MNIPQKILTVLFVILFVLGTIIAVSDGRDQLQNSVIVWVVLGVIYVGLFFVFGTRRK